MDPEFIALNVAVFGAAALQSATGIGFGVIAGPVLLITLNDGSAILLRAESRVTDDGNSDDIGSIKGDHRGQVVDISNSTFVQPEFEALTSGCDLASGPDSDQ